ncbi:MAG: helix-turn-helix domain-containing protein [Alphaproteobacteria bacterium]|nr:helix-turn-helix domain-containing protein [Alphaproteobacteria bacterium]
MPKLSDRLKYIRAYYNLSQIELATKAGTTQQAIQQAESGKARQPRYLHHLAQTLELPIEWMMFGDAQKEQGELPKPALTNELSDRANDYAEADVVNNFFSMPEKDQDLIYELMKSRSKDKND